MKDIVYVDGINTFIKEALQKVEIENVGSVQKTEKDCIISLKDLNAKEKLITEGISLRESTVQLLDVEKTITNVTIKDAPYELETIVILQHKC